ncbi:hypothetical protein QYE92_09820 [Enterobacter cloacae subsp. cloacae]|uniref:hypothetical protein n=1 Tax=Enterobacteriaceae TaxID=543 RepID=UPI000C0423AB|nr:MULTISPECIES: hypothetical protein [Enterobacteriaceae]EKS6329513.1 hypothetical protein [Enterobacter hormaechei]EKS6508441.1 hypothetical protein [Enterobacter hormaechei]EKT4031084.1 hypothetical protein [Enterobacter hormaechei]EKZ1440451.1 hypothetical protein [Enterobacter hormaechei]EMC3889619.1 hypothetical protein [Enterobacter hormaechei]
MDIDLITMSISALALAISVYAAVPVPEQKSKQIKRAPPDQLPPEVRKLIENVDELERIAKSL